MRFQILFSVALCLSIVSPMTINAGGTSGAEDVRIMVDLPSKIQNKMLENMRDHIRALDDIINAVQAEEYDQAESIAESRLGWSSLVRQGDQEVARHWPEPMQKMADQMYRSASNFVIVSQNAAVEDSKEGYQKVIEALGEVTTACRNCHEAYRVR